MIKFAFDQITRQFRTNQWKWICCVLICAIFIGNAFGNPPGHGDPPAEPNPGHGGEHGGPDAKGHGDGGHGEGGKPGHEGNGSHHEGGHRFHVAKFDFEYVKIPFIVGVWILYATVAKLFFHWEKYLSKYFPESCLLILMGITFGGFLYAAGEVKYEVNTTIFFLVLLPPIILDAGYYMPARSFFDQLGTILLYAILGTLINNLMIGFALWGVYEGGGFQNLESPLLLLHALVLGSLLAAVDPVAVLAVFESVHVNEMLYIIVFGESLLNDGISVVLYHIFEGYSEIGRENIQGIDIIAGIASFFVIVFGATGIGMLLGLLAGFISRFTKHVRKMEPLIVLVIGYLSFIIAEMFHLSGIISCTFCGITMRKYVEANYSEKSQKTIHILLKMFAQASETIVFMYIGMTAVVDMHHWDTAFCILTLIFCLIFRTIGVIVQTYLANMIRVVKLTKIDQFIMAYGGLRGAIAFALVLLLDEELFPHRRMFITSTVLVIYFTNIAMGSTIEPLVRFLKVKRQVSRKPTMGEKITLRFIDHVMGGMEDVTGQRGHHLLRERFSHWNNTFLKPLIVGKKNPQKRGWQVVNVYNQINQKVAKHHLHKSGSSPSFLLRDMSTLDLHKSSSSNHLNSTSSTLNHVDHGHGNWWDSDASLIPRESPRDFKQIHDCPILDHHALESQDSKRMRDASKTHHISEDMSGPIILTFKERKNDQGDAYSHHQPTIYSIQTQSEVPFDYRHLEEAHDGVDEAARSSGSIDSRGRKIVSFANLKDASEEKIDIQLSDQDPTQIRPYTGPPPLELPIPWKKVGRDEDDEPVFSPSARSRVPAHFEATAVDVDADGGIVNLGFAVVVDDPQGSRSSSSSGSHDDRNVNNNNRNMVRPAEGWKERGRPWKERGTQRDPLEVMVEVEKDVKPIEIEYKEDIEMREIVLDPLDIPVPLSAARRRRGDDEDEEDEYDAEFRKTYSRY